MYSKALRNMIYLTQMAERHIGRYGGNENAVRQDLAKIVLLVMFKNAIGRDF